MNFFVSGRIDDIENVRAVMRKIVVSGHKVTHDWTKTDAFLGSTTDKLNDVAESGLRASNDIQGVLDADVYVLVSSNATVGKGMYVELGAALAAQQLGGKTKVYIIGPMNHLSVFYLHPAVLHKDTIEDVFDSL
jgi:hypothetical protein